MNEHGTVLSSTEVRFQRRPGAPDVDPSQLASRDDMVAVSGGWHTHLAVLVERANGRVPSAFWDLFRSIDGQCERRVPR